MPIEKKIVSKSAAPGEVTLTCVFVLPVPVTEMSVSLMLGEMLEIAQETIPVKLLTATLKTYIATTKELIEDGKVI